jgi:hypothetical protein
VELWLRSNSLTQANMWIGLKRTGTVWVLGDGSIAGGGGAANSTAVEHRHFAAANVATQGANPTFTCGRSTSTCVGPGCRCLCAWHGWAAHCLSLVQLKQGHWARSPGARHPRPCQLLLSLGCAAGAYTDYLGNSIFVQLKNTTLYTTSAATDTNAWLATLCSSGYNYMCEINPVVYACPRATPPAPPPPAAGLPCEPRHGLSAPRCCPSEAPGCEAPGCGAPGCRAPGCGAPGCGTPGCGAPPPRVPAAPSQLLLQC